MRRNSVGAGLAAILVLAALVYVAWPEDGPQVPASSPAGSAPAAAPEPGTLQHGAPTLAGTATPAPAPTRTVAGVPANPEAVPSAADLRVRVVDGVTGTPVPNAAVWIAAMNADLEAALREAGTFGSPRHSKSSDPLAPLRARPVLFTDAAGEVDAASIPATGQFVVGASDAAEAPASRRLGWRGIDRAKLTDSRVIDVTIDARTAVTLRVRSADGKPCAGVPLRIGLPSGTWLMPLWQGTTGSDGSATVADLVPRARAIAAALSSAESFAALRAIAYVDAPLGVRPRAELAPGALPAEPVDLLLPPTGSLRVDLDAAGAAPVRAAEVFVEEIGLPEDERALALSPGIELQAGTARLPFVGLHLRLRVTVRITGTSQPCVVEADGPIGAGEERRVVVPVLGDAAVIVARLLDPDGKPLAHQSFLLRVLAKESGSSNETSTQIESDADARVRIGQDDKLSAAAERSIEFQQEKLDLGLTIQVPKALPKGETDLGDLRLEAAPLLVSGQVVGSDGQPIANAEVQVDDVDEAHTRTAADGSFVIRSRASVASTTLRASARAFLPSGAIEIVPGTRDLRVRLDAAGVLLGEVLLDLRDVRVHLFVDARERRTDATAREQVGGGRFEFEHVVPGTHDVSVRLAGVAEPLAQAKEVVVTAGATTKLPPFDLRGRLRRIAFRVLDEHGSPLRQARALMTDDVGRDGKPVFDGVVVDEGRGTVVTSKAQVDLIVFAPGRRTVFVPAIQDGQQVTLTPAPAVVVRVPAAVLPAPPLQFSVEIVAADDRYPSAAKYVLRGVNSTHSTSGSLPWGDDQRRYVDAGGQVSFPLRTTGRHRVRCWVIRRDGKSLQRAEVQGVTPAEFTLSGEGSVPVLELAVTADAVARAVAGL